MQINIQVKFGVNDLNIEGYHSDYNYLIDEVDTDVYKEVDTRSLVFHAEFLDELAQIEDDIAKIVNQVEEKIEELEEQEQESAIDKGAELHMYYMQNTI